MLAAHYPKALFDEYLAYDETSSTLLRWKKRPGTTVKVGDEVGNRACGGYWRFQLKGKTWKLHRVIYIMLNGEIDRDLDVDHKDRNKDNNHPSNLEAKTCSGNNLNKQKGKGRYARKRGNRWEAHYTMPVTRKYVYVGRFETEEKARMMAMAHRLESYWVI
jgi:stalled ribosome alternative rescue factor ArfA